MTSNLSKTYFRVIPNRQVWLVSAVVTSRRGTTQSPAQKQDWPLSSFHPVCSPFCCCCVVAHHFSFSTFICIIVMFHFLFTSNIMSLVLRGFLFFTENLMRCVECRTFLQSSLVQNAEFGVASSSLVLWGSKRFPSFWDLLRQHLAWAMSWPPSKNAREHFTPSPSPHFRILRWSPYSTAAAYQSKNVVRTLQPVTVFVTTVPDNSQSE